MTKPEAISQAIELIKGRELPIGSLVACKSDKYVWTLDSYEGDQAHCSINERKIQFPKSEIFDPKKLSNVANHLLNVGFWREGLESTILTSGG
jgi:hypothetical protein